MKRILFLDQFSDLGGGQLCLLDLLAGAAEAGWAPEVAVPGEGALVDRLGRLGVPVHRLSLRSYLPGRKSLRDGLRFLWDARAVAGEIRKLVEHIDPAVVYVNGPRLMPPLARARLAVPVVYHAHNRLAGAGKRLVEAAVPRLGVTVIAASRYVWDGPTARVVYGGVDGPGRKPHRTGRQPAIGLIGRIEAQKGQREFVDAAGRLPQDWRFVVCGEARPGDARAERYREAVRAAAPASVEFLGWRDDVYAVLAELDLLVVPSAGEGGAPRVMLEAFAAGVPVLALSSGAIPEVVHEGENGFLLASAWPDEIARCLRELVADPTRRNMVAERALRDWHERFTVQRYRKEVWEVVEGVRRRQKMAAANNPTAAVDTSGPG